MGDIVWEALDILCRLDGRPTENPMDSWDYYCDHEPTRFALACEFVMLQGIPERKIREMDIWSRLRREVALQSLGEDR
jgi:hypothetical protein